MKLGRRQFLNLTAGAVLPAFARVARGQAYPSHLVRWIVGYPPGGSPDAIARLIAQWLSERLGQPFIIENRPGAGSTLAAEAVVRSPPDGYTLLFSTSADALSATLYDKLNFNFIRDLAPIGSLGRGPLVMVVSPTLPAKTVPGFIGYAKANPGNLNYAAGGLTPWTATELFKMMTGIDVVHVPYRGPATAITDLLSGQVQVMFTAIPFAIEHVKSGKLTALAVTAEARVPELPDVPAMAEFLPGFEASAYAGVVAPMGTPTVIIRSLNTNINAALADPTIKSRLARLGVTALPSSPSEFGKLIADETEKWGEVIRATNIKSE